MLGYDVADEDEEAELLTLVASSWCALLREARSKAFFEELHRNKKRHALAGLTQDSHVEMIQIVRQLNPKLSQAHLAH